jgi:hypothetical protein
MKLLTATAQGQGERENDFHWCLEGELVLPPILVCARDAKDPDGGCGCGRAFTGLGSQRATTTAVVRDIPGVTPAEYTAMIHTSLADRGWDVSGAEDIARGMIALAARLPEETVIERRLELIQPRRSPAHREQPR